MDLRKIFLIACLIFCGTAAMAQKGSSRMNLPNFDTKQYHFGFLLGFNSADVYIDRKEGIEYQDSLLSVNSTNQPGFNLGIVAALHFNKNITVRFLPTLSFEDRVLNYVFRAPPNEFARYEKRIESTYIDFPINFKFRTDRLGNTAYYALAGGRYRINMQSEKDVKNEVAEEILVKTDKNDFVAEFGGGVDFFLPYFKFGIELKMGVGVKNLLIPETTQFSNPLRSLRSRTILISLTFEG